MFERLKLWKQFKKIKTDNEYDNKRILEAWMGLGVDALNNLKNRLKINQDAIAELLIMDKDKKDIKKAMLYGRIAELTKIINLAEESQKLYERRVRGQS